MRQIKSCIVLVIKHYQSKENFLFSSNMVLLLQNKTDNYVVSELSPPLLGHPAIKQLKLLARLQEVQEIPSPIHKYPKLFTGLGRLSARALLHQTERGIQTALT